MQAITKRAIGVVSSVGSITVALTLGGISTASAHGPGDGGGGGKRCDTVGVEYKVDGGHWTRNGRINGDTPPTKISVRLTDRPGSKCEYNVSLASYSAEGPAWENSGQQGFLGWDTVTLSAGKTEAALDVSAHAPTCFGQVDLYGNGVEYDGGSDNGHGALPHYPDSVTPPNLITAWNGGHECQASTSPSPSDSASASTSPSASASTSASTSPSASASTSPSASTSASASTAPSVSASASTPASTAAPTGTPSVPPASSSSSGSSGTGDLAETGSNGSQTATIAGGAAALLVAGGAAVYFTRRRRGGAHH